MNSISLPKPSDIDISGLHEAAKSAVPMLDGISANAQFVEFRRLGTNPFTDGEIALLQAVLVSHDPVTIRRKRETDRAAFDAELARDPLQIPNLVDRVRRLEIIQNYLMKGRL